MCEICSSPLLEDVNLKINWRPDRLTKWANKRGLAIDTKQLDEHFTKHVDDSIKKKRKVTNKNNSPTSRRGLLHKPSLDSKSNSPCKLRIQPDNVLSEATSGRSRSGSDSSKARKNPTPCPDEQLLNEIICRVFEQLNEGNFILKLEHGFKAIEIKQKLSGGGDAEHLLMELLNEIRRQELASDG